MIEIIRNRPKSTGKRNVEPIDLYQMQMEGLKKGWLVYPTCLNPLTLTIKKRKKPR